MEIGGFQVPNNPKYCLEIMIDEGHGLIGYSKFATNNKGSRRGNICLAHSCLVDMSITCQHQCEMRCSSKDCHPGWHTRTLRYRYLKIYFIIPAHHLYKVYY